MSQLTLYSLLCENELQLLINLNKIIIAITFYEHTTCLEVFRHLILPPILQHRNHYIHVRDETLWVREDKTCSCSHILWSQTTWVWIQLPPSYPHLLAVWCWASSFTFLYLGFFTCKMGRITVPVSWGNCEDIMR